MSIDNCKLFVDNLSTDNKLILEDFFNNFDRHCDLEKKEKQLLKEDFYNALIYYNLLGISLKKSLKLLDINNLGGFYSRPSMVFYPLDDAAKIYPLSMKKGYMAVFRLSMYLKENVIPEILQMALTFTIKRFPTFAVTVKKGFFWHHLDSTKRRYCVNIENDIPCQSLKISLSGSQTFRVIYYNNRISVEFFHILTDGTGGMIFLKTLVSEYFRLLGISSKSKDILKINDLPNEKEIANEFDKIKLKNTPSNKFLDKFANQIGGKLSKHSPCQIIHFKMNSELLKLKSKEKNSTITAYILSKIFLAMKHSSDYIKGEYNIQVPVNIRKYYPSKTIRNFSMYCGIRMPINEIKNNNTMYKNISKQLIEKASFESMNNMLINTKKMINGLKYVPLFIKTLAAKSLYGFFEDRIFTSKLSNIGVITMPENLEKHIESMDIILGPSQKIKVCCSLVTFNNVTTLTITKTTIDPSFEENLYKYLNEDGIDIIVEGSPLYED